MKEVEMRLELPDDKDKKEAEKIVFELSAGIDSFAMDMKDKKLTLYWNKNPVTLVVRLSKLSGKLCYAEMVAVGPGPTKEARLELHDDKDKKEAGKIVFELSGIDSIAMDPITNKKLTLNGNKNKNPVTVGARLSGSSKLYCKEIIAKKEKEEPKKENA